MVLVYVALPVKLQRKSDCMFGGNQALIVDLFPQPHNLLLTETKTKANCLYFNYALTCIT